MSRPAGALVPAAEVALAVVTLAVVLGLDRLFEGGGWLGPLTLHAAVAHGVMALARRRHLPLALTGVLTLVGLGLLTTWTTFGHTTRAWLPTGQTWDALGAELDLAWLLYQDVSAPAAAVPGFVATCAAAVWLIAFVADWAAFRVWVPFEATLPAATLFLFTALLGTPAGRGWATAAFVGSVLAFLLLHRTARRDGASHWVADRRQQGHRALLGTGAVLGAVAVVAGVALGPSLPGADRPGIVDLDDLGGQPPRRTISPLVDIRNRLVDQSDQVMFRVRASEPAYWRLTSLDTFDGERWWSSTSFSDADERLPVAVEPSASAIVEQEYSLERLAAIWLPAAFVPQTFESLDDADALYHADSATLIVDRDRETSDGLSYRITSISPRFSAEELAGVTSEVPEAIARDNLELPDSFSPRVAQLAAEITAGADTPYAAARALQDHLRTFTYDQSIPPGHSDDALEAFLFELQRGYCEQFAGAFAAMARSVGLPARVAVGFTPGEEDPEEPGTYVVRGVHAHAWPEVYFAGVGWVSFEPTPGRGQPFNESHTGVAPAQASAQDQTSVTLPPTTAPPPIPSEADLPTPDGPQPREIETGGAPDGAVTEQPSSSWWSSLLARPLGIAALALAALAVAVPLASIALRLWHRARRRRGAASPGARVAAAWDEVLEAAQPLGFVPAPSATPDERAEALARLVADDEVVTDAAVLGATLSRSLYAPDGARDDDADQAETAAASLVEALRARTPRAARLRWWLDPRDQVRAWGRERSIRRRHVTGAVRGSSTPPERDLQPLG